MKATRTKKITAVALVAACTVTMLAIPALAAENPKISQCSAIIEKGDTVKLKLKNTKKKVMWSSARADIATVSKKGVVKAKENGSTEIIGTIGKQKYTCQVRVESPKLSFSKKTVLKGQNFILKLSPTTQKVTWKTSNKKVASIKKGVAYESSYRPCDTSLVMVTGKKKGTAVISAKVGKKTYKCKVTVTTKRKKADDFTEAMAGTAMHLFGKVVKSEKADRNVLISPDSIITAVTIAENGAAGDTLKEMQAVLGKLSLAKYNKGLQALHRRIGNGSDKSYYNINALWYRSGQVTMKQDYLKTVRKYYGAKVYEEPFDNATAGKINQWVSDQTRGKITNIVDNIEDDAMAFITNAVYFNSDWEKKYDATVSGKFAGSDGKTKKVKMLEGMEETYITARGAKGFIKEYAGGDFAMMTLLPPKNTTARKFAMGMTGKDWIDAYRNRVTENIHVYTRMPEFQYEYKAELNKVFRSMGMEMAFSDFADFSKMAAPSLKIDGILHKTFIRVDKDGTEAAAVTNIGMKLTSAMPKPEQWIEKKVYLTRPFVYAIIDTKTGIPLFVSVLEQV